VTKARRVFGLHLAVAAAGAAALAFVSAAALSTISLTAPSSGALARACRSFVLPEVTPASLAVLGIGSLAFAVVALAVRSAWRQVRATRRFMRRLELIGPGPAGTVVFAEERPQAFCAGLLRPRVYLSRGAVNALAPAELEAVIAHEGHHARHRDPLRVLFAGVLGDALFFLPALRRLSQRYSALAEMAADAAAVRRHGDPQPLAAALLAFDEATSPAVIGIDPERVDHLLGEPPRWELPLALLAWTLVIVGALVAVAWRMTEATAHATVSLPLLAAQLCMVAMAAVPLAVGASALLAGRRLVVRRRAP
jgi:Zn-dependent protease with chaperone function